MAQVIPHFKFADDATIEISRRIGGVGRLRVTSLMTDVAMRVAAREIDAKFPNLARLQRSWKINTLAASAEFPDVRMENLAHYAAEVGLLEEWNALKAELGIVYPPADDKR